MWSAFKNLLAQFMAVDDEAFALAKPYFKECHLSKGDFFVKEGEICQKLAYVHTGIFRSFYINEKGEDITYCFCSDNDMETSFQSFLLKQPSLLSIQAMEDAQLLTITKTDLDYLFDTNLFWAKTGRLFSEREYLKMEQHASESKMETAKEKYLRILDERPTLLQKVPLHYVASYLGISSRHLTRLRRELTDAAQNQ